MSEKSEELAQTRSRNVRYVILGLQIILCVWMCKDASCTVRNAQGAETFSCGRGFSVEKRTAQ